MASETNSLAISKTEEKRFERGFKTWCENTAISIRKRMDLDPSSPLPPTELAKNMGVTILELDQVSGLATDTYAYLSSPAGDEWSAVTVHTADKQIIVVNPRHSQARQASNVMHELAHIIRGHEPAKVYVYEAYALRDFDQIQENEANWFAGCLLLPRTALLNTAYRNEALEDSLERFCVSKSLYNYRVNVSGVRRQLQYVKG